MAAFPDHFSAQASDYARFRPTYPAALFDWLAFAAPSRHLAWDVGTGSGQCAVALAGHFDRVVATDPSARQLAEAHPHARVSYRREPAERTALASGSVDLVTVAQALHWFDREAFFREASRVLVSRGVLAVWCYEIFECTTTIDEVVAHFYRDVVGPYWPAERKWIEQGYEGIEMPFPTIDAPPFEMALEWTLDDLVGYLGTWSATQRYTEANGKSPLGEVRAKLEAAWGDAVARRVRWPLSIKACRKP